MNSGTLWSSVPSGQAFRMYGGATLWATLNSTAGWAAASDERLKELVQDADTLVCYNTMKRLPLKYFKWKEKAGSSDSHALGWIAQTVEQVFPNSVVKSKENYGDEVIEDLRQLNHDQLYRTAYGAVQHLQKMVEQLQNLVETLQGRVLDLETRVV